MASTEMTMESPMVIRRRNRHFGSPVARDTRSCLPLESMPHSSALFYAVREIGLTGDVARASRKTQSAVAAALLADMAAALERAHGVPKFQKPLPGQSRGGPGDRPWGAGRYRCRIRGAGPSHSRDCGHLSWRRAARSHGARILSRLDLRRGLVQGLSGRGLPRRRCAMSWNEMGRWLKPINWTT